MDLCGPMRVQTINGKKYIFVIVDDYSSIFHQKLVPRTPQQNGVVERQKRTLPAKEKSSKLAPAPKPKVTKEKPSNPSHARHPKRDKVQKLRKGKTPLQLINEDEPTQPQPEPEPEHHGKGDEYDVERAIQMSLESFQAQSQAQVGGVAIREPVRRTPATEEASTGPFVQPQDNASANIVRDSSSPADAETCTDTDKINSGGDTEIL
ncbi:retrotransposon protein, putative, unclassified [Tanacetum coccineum]